MPVVARAGQALGGNGPLFAAGAGLQRVEEAEADGLLQLGVALDLDIGAMPEAVEVLALAGHQSVPPGVHGSSNGRCNLVAQGEGRPLRRPPVGQDLDDPQRLSRGQVGCDQAAGQVGEGFGFGGGSPRSLHQVVHAGRHPSRGALR